MIESCYTFLSLRILLRTRLIQDKKLLVISAIFGRVRMFLRHNSINTRLHRIIINPRDYLRPGYVFIRTDLADKKNARIPTHSSSM